jgi:hypothetical protein
MFVKRGTKILMKVHSPVTKHLNIFTQVFKVPSKVCSILNIHSYSSIVTWSTTFLSHASESHTEMRRRRVSWWPAHPPSFHVYM